MQWIGQNIKSRKHPSVRPSADPSVDKIYDVIYGPIFTEFGTWLTCRPILQKMIF